MAKPYIPKVTVTFRREFDGKVEREQSLTTTGDAAEHLEAAVYSLLALAMAARPQQVPTPAEGG
jgi:hypothetical protein